MKGFNLKKILPKKMLFLTAVGFFVWCLAFFFTCPREVLSSFWQGIQAFGFVIAISAAAMAFRATAWKLVMVKEGRPHPSLISVLLASVAVGGTPVRLAILKRKTGILDGAESVVLDKALGSLANLIFILFGLFFGFVFTPGNSLMRGLMLIAAVSGFGYVVIVSRGSKSFFTSLLNGLPKQLVSPAIRGRFEERDRCLNRLKTEKPALFSISLIIHLAIWVFLILEILVIGRAMNPDFPLSLALSLGALISVLRLVFSFIPAAFGFLEGGLAFVLAIVLGMPLAPLGVSIPLLLRLRTLIWWGIGWGVAGNPLKILFGK